MKRSFPAWRAALALVAALLVLAACAPQSTGPYNSVGDLVWADSNGNGLQDAGEPGVANVTVRLLDAGGGIMQEIRTDGDGLYEFPEVPNGEYSLLFTAPSGMGFTLMDSGQDDTLDSDAYQASGETDPFSIRGDISDQSHDAGLVGKLPQPTETPGAPPASTATPMAESTGPALVMSTTYEHTVPGSYSEIIVQIDNLLPGQVISGVATGPVDGAVDDGGIFSATADEYGTAIARIKIYQYGDYTLTLDELGLSATVQVTAEDPSSN